MRQGVAGFDEAEIDAGTAWARERKEEERKEGDGGVATDVRVPPVSEEKGKRAKGYRAGAGLGRGKRRREEERGVRVGCWLAGLPRAKMAPASLLSFSFYKL